MKEILVYRWIEHVLLYKYTKGLVTISCNLENLSQKFRKELLMISDDLDCKVLTCCLGKVRHSGIAFCKDLLYEMQTVARYAIQDEQMLNKLFFEGHAERVSILH